MRKIEQYAIWKKEEYSYSQAFGFTPNIMSYIHEDNKERPCLLVVPGGGYLAVAPSEGELVALRFYELGYQTFVLSYTINPLVNQPVKMQPLQDISRAVRVIRSRVEEFNIDRNRVFLCGFSAGGHLSASLCVHYNDVKDIDNSYQKISNRPDAAILSYPVITSGEYAHKHSFTALLGSEATEEEKEYMSLEKHVNENTPPCFVWTTATDEMVPVQNSKLYVEACEKKGIIHAFHLFSHGHHGLSLADEGWAEGKNMNPYTMEQVMNAIKAGKEGKVVVPQEILEMFEENKEIGGQKPNKEVAMWPVLADEFLKYAIH